METKTFWKANQDELKSPDKVQVIYKDGKPFLYGYYDNDGKEPDEFYPTDNSSADFFETEAEAVTLVTDRRTSIRRKMKTAVEFIDKYYDTGDLSIDVPDSEKEDWGQIKSRYKVMYDSGSGDYTCISKYTAESQAQHAVDIVLNKKPINGTTRSFFFREISHVEFCKDNVNDKKFINVYLYSVPDPIMIYEEKYIRALKFAFDETPRISIHNNALSFLNKD